MRLFNGNKEAKILSAKIKQHVQQHPVSKKLLIVQVGDREESSKYISLKQKFCQKMNIPVEVKKFSTQLPVQQVLKEFEELVNDQHIKSVIVQIPLPSDDYKKMLDLIPVEKDVDVLSSLSQRKYYENTLSFKSPVVRAVEHFVNDFDLDLKNKNVLVVGGGFLVGKPVAHYLDTQGANVHITEDYKPNQTQDAFLVVSSVGIAYLVNSKDLPHGCNVIDFGAAPLNGKLVGDVQLTSTEHLGNVSPSPGGMGPLVVRYLIMNHLGI